MFVCFYACRMRQACKCRARFSPCALALDTNRRLDHWLEERHTSLFFRYYSSPRCRSCVLSLASCQSQVVVDPRHLLVLCVPPSPPAARPPAALGASARRARIEHLRTSRGVLSIGGRFILANTPGFTVAHPGLKRGNINFDLAESLSRLVSNVLCLRRE